MSELPTKTMTMVLLKLFAIIERTVQPDHDSGNLRNQRIIKDILWSAYLRKTTSTAKRILRKSETALINHIVLVTSSVVKSQNGWS